jgi:exopolyphosphatase / guanosine-5'-triphosphate,3'-diphosphate pyrophosphatase
LMGCHQPDGLAGDLGGGPLELIDIANHTLSESVTLPLGGLRLIDVSGGRLDKAQDATDAALARVPWLAKGRDRTFFAVGGTWRALAKMHMEANDYPLRVMHGYAIPGKDAIDFCEEIRKSKKLSSLAGARAVPKARRDVLPYGALTLERVLKRVQPKRVEFSVFGVREGMIYSLLTPDEQRQDPLIAFATETSRIRSRSVDHAWELCAWTDPLFKAGLLQETADERRQRHAACLMSDVGWRAHPDYRGEQTLNLVAHAALAGIDHPGRMFLALAIYFRHDGDDEPGQDRLSERLRKVLPPQLLRRAQIVGAAVRAAHMISIGQPGLIPHVPLAVTGRSLTLQLPADHAVLDGERLRRRLGDLAKLLGLEGATVTIR